MNRIKSFLIQHLTAAFSRVLENEQIKKQIWEMTHVRPDSPEMFYTAIPNSMTEELYKQATESSVAYVRKHMLHLVGWVSPFDVLSVCLEQVTVDGLYLEFGVFSGSSINHIASHTSKVVHGFDSFEGLPETWNGAKKGTFDMEGQLPEVAQNVELHKGWFEDSIPAFRSSHSEPIAFLHIDSDLYSSAKTIFTHFKDRIVPGTIIVFDEYFNYPGWELHEYLAFQEFISETGMTYEYIAYANHGFSVGVKITRS